MRLLQDEGGHGDQPDIMHQTRPADGSDLARRQAHLPGDAFGETAHAAGVTDREEGL
jgi:hypothetical protein